MSAQELGVRVNGIAPFLLRRISAGFAREWSEERLDENSSERVAEAVALVALDDKRKVVSAGTSSVVLNLSARKATHSPRFLGCRAIPMWIGGHNS